MVHRHKILQRLLSQEVAQNFIQQRNQKGKKRGIVVGNRTESYGAFLINRIIQQLDNRLVFKK